MHTYAFSLPSTQQKSRGPPQTKSNVNKDFKSLEFLNLKSQNFSKISKFQDFSDN